MSRFKKATREKLRLRMALDGPAGSGKTLTMLRFAFALGKRIAVIDSEHRSASKYQGECWDGDTPFDFDVLNLANCSPTDYTAAIIEAGNEGYEVIGIDSLSHAWAGEGGALDLKDKQGGNSFTAWKNITPMHNRMIDAILKSPAHIIATMRSKVEYVLEEDDKGKMAPRKVGMAPIQRNGMEYEFDVYGSMDWTHMLTITKSRCPAIADMTAVKPGAVFLAPVIKWLESGAEPVQIARIDEERVAYLNGLISKLTTPPAKFAAWLRGQYKVDGIAGLTVEQGDDLERKTLAAIAKQRAKEEAALNHAVVAVPLSAVEAAATANNQSEA